MDAMMQTRKKRQIFSLFLTVGFSIVTAVGCQSRSVEVSPKEVPSPALSPEDRASQKTRVDRGLALLQHLLEANNEIISALRGLFGIPNESEATPIDLLLAVNQKLQGVFPEIFANGLVQEANVELAFQGIDPSCQTVAVQLLSQPSKGDAGDIESESDDLIYSFRTCKSDDKFIPVVTFRHVGSALGFAINEDNLHKAFSGLISTSQDRGIDCKIIRATASTPETFDCGQAGFKIGNAVDVTVTKLKVFLHSETRFFAEGGIETSLFSWRQWTINAPATGEPQVIISTFAEKDPKE